MSNHSAGPPLELEIKFCLTPGGEATLEDHPVMRVGGGEAGEARHEVTVYFDTPAGDLASAGISLRVRRSGARLIQTLKLRSDSHGPFGRAEWEWPVEAESPNLDRLAETPIAAMFPVGQTLQPVFVTDVQRTTRVVRRDGATIELALDRGRVSADEAEEEIRELELELKDGDTLPLYRLAAALHASVPLSLSTESKADRGWRLRSGQTRPAVKYQDVDFANDVTAAEGFRLIIDAALAHLMANQPAAASAEVEGVHQMRVAIRRLRAALVLFKPLLEPHAEARFTDALQSLGRIFGEARDWDVFCTEMLEAADEDGVAAAWLELLREPAEAERIAAHSRVAVVLDEPTLTATVLGLAEWAGDAAALSGVTDGGVMNARLADIAPKLLRRLEHKALRRGHPISSLEDPELHALRKSLKKLRYSAEFLAPLHLHKRGHGYLHACKALLKQLGQSNDAVVAIALAERLGGERQPELAPAISALAGWATSHRAKARHKIAQDWRDFKSRCGST
jgi:inorganic triphosphatase YgiF